ncbi:hypothetical protein Cthiooxydans_29320 [Comamonas thiooxydans]|nr:hypothetical protein Cthiooxydans_29320 [Comamonas thiooxydans]
MTANLMPPHARCLPGHAQAMNCHHNDAQKERPFGEDVFITRKGAESARRGETGIYILRGLDNPESFEGCSHGAGRVRRRTQAKKLHSVADRIKAKKDMIDGIPMAYKDIDAVMAAQKDLVEVHHTLSVKG